MNFSKDVLKILINRGSSHQTPKTTDSNVFCEKSSQKFGPTPTSKNYKMHSRFENLSRKSGKGFAHEFRKILILSEI